MTWWMTVGSSSVLADDQQLIERMGSTHYSLVYDAVLRVSPKNDGSYYIAAGIGDTTSSI